MCEGDVDLWARFHQACKNLKIELRPWTITMMRFIAALSALFICSACAAPIGVTVVALMADGVSYAATEKSISDHGLSAITEQDCAMHRVFTDGPVCSENEDNLEVAENLPFEPGQTVEQPGVYMVMASSYDFQSANAINAQHAAMKSQLFVMPAGVKEMTYHVISGPVTRATYSNAQYVAAQAGVHNTWALKIDERDWRIAKELHSKDSSEARLAN